MQKGILLFFSLTILLFACKKDEDDLPPMNYNPTPYEFEIPSNLPTVEDMDIPADNSTTVEGVKLGRMLFYDKILSLDSSMSCASCHNQARAFTDDGKQFSKGVDGLEGNMNAMQIFNLGWMKELFWDGRSVGMEEQAGQPVINPIELHEDWGNVVMKLQRHKDYPDLFLEAFGTNTISQSLATKAIAQFERTMISAGSRYDAFRRGETSSYTQSEFNGFIIFNSEVGDCFHCHSVDLLTDNDFHNNGLDSVFTMNNNGRFNVTNNTADVGKFKTASLRNLELTGPYMHDGRFATIEEVIEFYNSGVKQSPTVDPIMTKPGKELGLQLTQLEKDDLKAFLMTMTDTSFVNNPEFSDPF